MTMKQKKQTLRERIVERMQHGARPEEVAFEVRRKAGFVKRIYQEYRKDRGVKKQSALRGR